MQYMRTKVMEMAMITYATIFKWVFDLLKKSCSIKKHSNPEPRFVNDKKYSSYLVKMVTTSFHSLEISLVSLIYRGK